MSDNHSAKSEEGVEPGEEDRESVPPDRTPRAPSIQRLGRYRLVREIASGGMATVNLAVTEGLDKLVALKIIHPHLAQEDSFVRMFLDEARLASAISHRNVCNVFDFGEADGRFYIAMDFLSGQSLRDVLRRLRKVTLPMEPRKMAVYVAYLMAEACEGLHAAHELHNSEGKPLNVVHRDVSPHNLFVTYDGSVSVVDFGIARASDRIQSTATGVLKGKFSYMAPEQMRQLEIDRRADIWALGVVLWESLTLQRLFVRSSQADTVMSVMMDRVRPPSELKPDIPRELDAIALKAISRNPAQRYTTAREMGRELLKFCRESGVMVGPIEIEHLMEKLFEREIAENKTLTRKAKHSGTDGASWMDVTPSGYNRMRVSGSIEKGNWTSSPPSAVVSDSTGSIVTNMKSGAGFAPGSLSAPGIEARSTAHPDVTNAPERRQKPLLWIGAGAAVVLLLAVWGLVHRSTQAVAIIPPSPLPEVPTAPAAQEPPANPLPAAQEPTRVKEPKRREMQPPPVTSIAPTPAKSRNAPVHQPARPLPRSVLSSHARDPVEANPFEEAPPPVVMPTIRPEPEEEEAPAPPARVEVAAQPKPEEAPKPAAPQKLEARTSIDELDVEGSLGSSIVSRMLSRVTPALKACYAEAAKKANRNEYGSLASSLVIEEMGSVRQVSVARSGLGELSGCASAALKRVRPDRVPDVGTVSVKFKISYSP